MKRSGGAPPRASRIEAATLVTCLSGGPEPSGGRRNRSIEIDDAAGKKHVGEQLTPRTSKARKPRHNSRARKPCHNSGWYKPVPVSMPCGRAPASSATTPETSGRDCDGKSKSRACIGEKLRGVRRCAAASAAARPTVGPAPVQ
eukprot:CAMPEP_0176210194 /NCGR_PEP_ID=MMETSP0121_2-20121125/14019_1 /TAXON_ID=160619 /ORGANISM="Kryptoperidinium foliaceum, Strain CCMP 1326" /LENGTH=143 /DNA_ID=CAMNT_0017549221 /DNA_START=133 /DNA_END=562 /DNA_ORIENTATION=-